MNCAKPKCKSSILDDKWSKIRAHDEGWFFQKDGTAFCPLHVPEWVSKWRGRK